MRKSTRNPDIFMPPPERAGRGGSVVSVVIHGLIIFAIVWSPGVGDMLLDATRGGPGELGGGGGGGAERVTYVSMPAYQGAASAEVVTPEPEVVPEPQPVFKPQIINTPTVVRPDTRPRQLARVSGSGDGQAGGPGSGSGSGGGIGTGRGTGIGSNEGPGTGGGGGTIIPPSPRHAFLPPSGIPGSLRGRSFRVHFWVTAEGEVSKIRVTPEVEDSSYRNLFNETLMRYRFRPQLSAEGTPMAGEVEIVITL